MTQRSKKAGIFTTLILGIVFTVAGAAMVHFFGHDTYLVGSRDGGQCEIIRVGMFGKTEVVESFPVESLLGASVQQSKSSDGDTTYKVIIDTDQGTIPLTGYSSSGRGKHEANAELVNAFVQGQSDELSVKQSGTLIRIFGFVFAGIGILMLLGFIGMLIKLVIALILLVVSR